MVKHCRCTNRRPVPDWATDVIAMATPGRAALCRRLLDQYLSRTVVPSISRLSHLMSWPILILHWPRTIPWRSTTPDDQLKTSRPLPPHTNYIYPPGIGPNLFLPNSTYFRTRQETSNPLIRIFKPCKKPKQTPIRTSYKQVGLDYRKGYNNLFFIYEYQSAPVIW